MNNSSGKIIWLASYPKSGNTWTRLFLHALKTGAPIKSFDKIESTNGIGSNRSLFDDYLGIESDELNRRTLQSLRSEVYLEWSNFIKEPIIVKSHDTPFFEGIRIIPEACTRKVVLIVRNPFDMVASYANHMGISIDMAVYSLCDDTTKLAKSKKKYTSQVTQHTGSWSSYYWNWVNAFRSNVHVLKYEDLKQDPFTTFKSLVNYLEWDYSDDEILKAIDNSDFKKLKKVEETKGFKEASKKGNSFFRSGKSGNWKNEISQEHAKQLVDKHYTVLLELGYINVEGNILV